MKTYLQITSGRGPVECCRVVTLLVEKMRASCSKEGLTMELIDREPGPEPGTDLSVTLCVQGSGGQVWAAGWLGTVQWVAYSPYRPCHKRKNWFVGVNLFECPEETICNESDFSYETLRASGPGGQHVNKTESVVRAIHLPTGMSVVASDERSQWQNKSAARLRLLARLALLEQERKAVHEQAVWSNHNGLERGNAVKIIREPMKK